MEMQGFTTTRPHPMSPWGGGRPDGRRGADALVAFMPTCGGTPGPAAEAGPDLFAAEPGVELGRQGAQEVERTKRILRGARYERRVQGIVSRLARRAPGAGY